ncbi:MAG: hypothetical protein EAZ47_00485 [Bacteroidetes bacterium]|nr:MAG: hypothetical protein EAY72_11840 [Bacteroidota bacterium]TAE66924.1 MAG: hypothetical protein EAY68_05770 [Bacteroidota bacterium]TAF98368.1 MAG: hypothetical protein EAZ47_00485 [Bacteroidota bacterium]
MQEAPQELSIAELVDILKVHFNRIIGYWKLLSVMVVALFAIGYLYAFFQPVRYSAVTTFSIDEEQAGGGGLAGIAAQFGFDVGSSENSLAKGDNVLALFGSQKILGNLILSKAPFSNLSIADEIIKAEKIQPKRIKSFPFFKVHDSWKNTGDFKDSVYAQIIEHLGKKILSATKADKKIDIYNVVATTRNPVLSNALSTLVVQEVSNFYVGLKTEKSAQTVAILQTKVDSVRNVIRANMGGRAALLDANLNPAFQQPLIAPREKELEISSSSQALTELVKNLELSKYLLVKQTPLLQIIDTPRYPLKKVRMGRMLTGAGCVFLGMFLFLIYYAGKQVLAPKSN